jgi:hypothetical protein
MGVALTSVSCTKSGTPPEPFFRLLVTYDLETTTGAETTCSALGLQKPGFVTGTLATAVDNKVQVTGFPQDCAAGMGLVEDSGMVDGGLDYLELDGYGGELEDVYLQGFDTTGKLVAFGRLLGAVPANVTDNSVLMVHIPLKAPTVAKCGDGNATETGKMGCDDYLNNNCCLCNANFTGTCPY